MSKRYKAGVIGRTGPATTATGWKPFTGTWSKWI